jgi:hypothetical protein
MVQRDRNVRSTPESGQNSRRLGRSAWCRLCCKSPKLPGDKFPAIRRTNRRPPICVVSITLPKSPVSSSSGDEVPHIFTRKSRLQPGEFLVTSAKRLLQHNLPKAEVAVIRSLELIVQPDAKDVVGCCPRYRLTSDTGSLLEKPVRHSSKSVRAIRQPLFRDWPDAKVTSRVPQPRALKTPPVNSPVRS